MRGDNLRGRLTLPVTVASAASDGRMFGLQARALSRSSFELALGKQIRLMEQLLCGANSMNDVIAAFEREAWEAFQAGHRRSV